MALATVLIDQREPAWVQQLTFGGVPTAVTLLDHGDLQAVTDDDALLVFERKTADDLLNSLKDNRLFNQLAGLTSLTRWAYLVITGTLQRGPNDKLITDRGLTGWNWAAIQGALLTVQELGVFVIQTTDARLESVIAGLGKRNRNGTVRIPPAKQPAILSPGEAALASLPGVGLEKAAALIAYTGSAASALAYLTDLSLNATEHVPGIGPVTKRQVRQALGLPEWAELALIDKEQKLITNQEANTHGN